MASLRGLLPGDPSPGKTSGTQYGPIRIRAGPSSREATPRLARAFEFVKVLASDAPQEGVRLATEATRRVLVVSDAACK